MIVTVATSLTILVLSQHNERAKITLVKSTMVLFQCQYRVLVHNYVSRLIIPTGLFVDHAIFFYTTIYNELLWMNLKYKKPIYN